MSVADRTCACGRPSSAGRINAGPYGKCLICQVAQDLAGVRRTGKATRRPYIICRCCNTVGPHAGHGLIRSCYMREYRRCTT